MDALALSHAFLFGRYRLDPRGGGLFRQDATGAWAPVEIGSRALEVLGVLLERHGGSRVEGRDHARRLAGHSGRGA
jgi:hypothetical protein